MPVLGALVPRDLEHPVEVGPDHLVLGGGGGHPLESIDLAGGDGGDRLGQVRVGDAFAQLLDFAVALAELRLDGLHLLSQHVLPLRVGHLLLGLRFDLPLQLQHVDLAGERRGDGVELDQDAVFFEKPLLVFRLHVHEAGQQIGDAKRVVEVTDERSQIRRQTRRQRQRAVDELLQAADTGLDVERGRDGFRQRFDERREIAALALQEFRPDALNALDQHAHAGGRLGHLANDGDRANAIEVVGARLFRLVLLQQRQDHPIAGERAVHRFDRQTSPDAEWRDGQRQHDRAAKRHDGHLGGKRRSLWSISHRFCQQSSVFLLSSRASAASGRSRSCLSNRLSSFDRVSYQIPGNRRNLVVCWNPR